ncbi:hypothetical protein VNO77_12784 [Canavalia gladiata]|uniref:F-box associated beta-propeller type 1 domain-containing protein n=1 Tax=Canavalia gladiata TaxID=3824 RepID=A0AAN9LXQ8_CANGL
MSENCFWLWNPSTRLTSERVSVPFHYIHHGFGYDTVNDKYKLVLFREHDTGIYTFGADSWTRTWTSAHWPTDKLGIFCNGALHWLTENILGVHQWLILSFDLGKEAYADLVLPRQIQDDRHILNNVLAVLHGSLSVCLFDSKEAHWDMWLMEEYGIPESWTKLMVIPLVEPVMMSLSFRPLYISKDKVVLFKIYLSRLVLCDSNNDNRSYPTISDELEYHMELALNWHLYHESLISPHQQ